MKSLKLHLPVALLVLAVSCGKPQTREIPVNETVSSFLSYPNVTAIAEDATGHIWIGTSYGLNRALTYGYHQYFAGGDSLSLQSNHVTALYSDSEGRLWVAGKSGYLCYLTPEGTFRQVAIEYHEKVRVSFIEMSGGRLFCNDENSIFRYIPGEERMETLIDGPQKNIGCFPFGENLVVAYPDRVCYYSSSDGSLLSEYSLPEPCREAAATPDGRLWLSTMDGSGLQILQLGSMKPQEVPAKLKEALAEHRIMQIINEKKGSDALLFNVGDDILYSAPGADVYTLRDKGLSMDKQTYNINCVFYDSEDNVWLGTDGGGIQMLQNIHRWTRFHILLEYFRKIPVSALAFKEEENTVYVTDYRGRRYRYNLDRREVEAVPPSGSVPIPKPMPSRTLHLKDGRILSVNDNTDILVSSADKTLGYIIPVEKVRKILDSRNFHPTTLFQDSRGQIWIGTRSNGIAILDLEANSIRRISGVQGKDISSILENKDGQVMVATKSGLYEYSLDGEQVNFFSRGGHEGENAYMDGSYCILPDGIIMFGTMRGIVLNNPQKESQPVGSGRFFLEDLRAHNTIVRAGKGAPIAKAMVFSPPIRLRHDQNSFGISFTELNYWKAYEGSYSYMLEGFDKYWIESGSGHDAFYSNVPPGKYTFRARISNSSGDPSTFSSASCEVTILPAPWATWWAKTGYVLAAIGLLILAGYTYLRHARSREELSRIAQEKQQEQKMNDIIQKYFANVAHQLRTPLTLINGPIDTLYGRDSFSGRDRELLRMIRSSANRMLDLVNQIMNFHSLESDALALQVSKCDLVTPLSEAVELYRHNAEKKHITFLTNGLEGNIFVYADMEKVISIMGNLLSNALKFTPEGGSISVSLSYDGTQAQLDVFNSGSTIPEDQQEKIFSRFYQISDADRKADVKGSGVGLYYARKLAVLHHGTLTCNNQGDGVCFTLSLPVCQDAFTPEEQKDEKRGQPQMPAPDVEAEPGDRPDILKPRVLVVDDDVDITSYLKMLLRPAFQVRCCFDAESALRALEAEAPDLIISDVMMTGMSGLDFCNKVKGDLQYCHIPFILLTAKDSIQDQIEGLHVGADAYVTKPFNADYLLSLSGNLVKSRTRLQQYLSDNAGLAPSSDNALSPQDRAFLEQLYALWDDQISNPEFNIAAVVERLHVSHTKFIYKVKGLTGFTPSELFKNYKLNKAAAMLREGRFNVSEVADLTGFGTLANFSRVFKKKFGVPPSEYK